MHSIENIEKPNKYNSKLIYKVLHMRPICCVSKSYLGEGDERRSLQDIIHIFHGIYRLHVTVMRIRISGTASCHFLRRLRLREPDRKRSWTRVVLWPSWRWRCWGTSGNIIGNRWLFRCHFICSCWFGCIVWIAAGTRGFGGRRGQGFQLRCVVCIEFFELLQNAM